MLSPFTYRDGTLHVENVPLNAVAEAYGTPAYVYSRSAIEAAWRRFATPLIGRDHLICYAVKANSNLAVLNLLARLGSGFDIVSQGELERVLRAGGSADKVVFSGVAKSRHEITHALDAGIRCFNVESAAELERIAEIAELVGRPAPVSLRVNPDVDARTHPYISTGLRDNKFGIPLADAESLYLSYAQNPWIDLIGVDFHIGSQLLQSEPLLDALDLVLGLIRRLQSTGLRLRHIDIGGGIGVPYQASETSPDIDSYLQSVLRATEDLELELLVEPGRAIVAEGGLLLTRVEYLKNTPDKHFALVDGAMNDLLRPALYGAWQAIRAIQPRDEPRLRYDVVGPVCESADFLGKDRELALASGDLLAVMTAGAYGFVMASNYNTRPRPPEVLVDGNDMQLVRRRETLDDLLANEYLPRLQS